MFVFNCCIGDCFDPGTRRNITILYTLSFRPLRVNPSLLQVQRDALSEGGQAVLPGNQVGATSADFQNIKKSSGESLGR